MAIYVPTVHTHVKLATSKLNTIAFSVNILVVQKCIFNANEFVQCAKSLWPGEPSAALIAA